MRASYTLFQMSTRTKTVCVIGEYNCLLEAIKANFD